MNPTIGRVVHYQSYGTPGGEYQAEPRAALITAVKGCDPNHQPGCPHVSLAVLNPTGLFFTANVPYAQTPTPGHWSWPPRV